MIDVLDAVYDFILQYAWRNDDVPQYDPGQIVRGWQNAAVLPNTTEFCVITTLSTVRHGTPVDYSLVTTEEINAQYAKVSEYLIQVDFCSAEPNTLPEVTKARADIIEMLFFTHKAAEFFNQYEGLGLMYADDVRDLSYLDENKLYNARYSVTLHISNTVTSSFYEQPSFNNVHFDTVHVPNVENVDIHHD